MFENETKSVKSNVKRIERNQSTSNQREQKQMTYLIVV